MTTQRSTRRERQAAATREDILVAARRLFSQQGYVATSMGAIADAADTAVQTIYDSIGPKRSVMLALIALAEEEAGVGPFRERLMETRDARDAIALWVALTRQFIDRGSDILAAIQSAVPAEPEVAAAFETAKRNHQTGARLVGALLERLGALAPGLTGDRAGDIIGVLTWGTIWQDFLKDHEWSVDECEAWLTRTLRTLLLKETP